MTPPRHLCIALAQTRGLAERDPQARSRAITAISLGKLHIDGRRATTYPVHNWGVTRARQRPKAAASDAPAHT